MAADSPLTSNPVVDFDRWSLELIRGRLEKDPQLTPWQKESVLRIHQHIRKENGSPSRKSLRDAATLHRKNGEGAAADTIVCSYHGVLSAQTGLVNRLHGTKDKDLASVDSDFTAAQLCFSEAQWRYLCIPGSENPWSSRGNRVPGNRGRSSQSPATPIPSSSDARRDEDQCTSPIPESFNSNEGFMAPEDSQAFPHFNEDSASPNRHVSPLRFEEHDVGVLRSSTSNLCLIPAMPNAQQSARYTDLGWHRYGMPPRPSHPATIDPSLIEGHHSNEALNFGTGYPKQPTKTVNMSDFDPAVHEDSHAAATPDYQSATSTAFPASAAPYFLSSIDIYQDFPPNEDIFAHSTIAPGTDTYVDAPAFDDMFTRDQTDYGEVLWESYDDLIDWTGGDS